MSNRKKAGETVLNVFAFVVVLIFLAFWIQLLILLKERPLLPDTERGFVFPIPHNGLTTFVTKGESVRLLALMISSGIGIFAVAGWLILRGEIRGKRRR